MIKISIIVPVYNVEKYLDKCLNSLINQTNQNFEAIIVNDGSTDGSEKIVKKYDNNPMIKYFKKKNGGLSSARNYGIKKASGDYLLFLDGDDYLEKDAVDILLKQVEKNYDIIVFNIKSINEDKVINDKSFNKDIEDDFNRYIVSAPSACNKLIKKEIFIKNNLEFKKGVYYEDLELIPSLALYTKKIKFIDNKLYNYIVRNNSILNQSKFNPKIDDIFIVIDSIYSKLKDKYPKEMEYLYIEHLLRNASLRYLDYKKYDRVDKIVKSVKDKYKYWYKNNYFKSESNFKQKVLCFLIMKKQYKLIGLLRK